METPTITQTHLFIDLGLFLKNEKSIFKWAGRKTPREEYASMKTVSRKSILASVDGALEEGSKKMITIDLFDMDVAPNHKGIFPSISVTPKNQGRVHVQSNFGTPLNIDFMKNIWTHGAFTFARTLAEIEEFYAKQFKTTHTPWLKDFFSSKRIKKHSNWPDLFEIRSMWA